MDEATEAKLNSMHGDILSIKEELIRMNGFQREDHDRITRLEERMKIFTGIQTAISFALSSIAAWLGMR